MGAMTTLFNGIMITLVDRQGLALSVPKGAAALPAGVPSSRGSERRRGSRMRREMWSVLLTGVCACVGVSADGNQKTKLGGRAWIECRQVDWLYHACYGMVF